MNPDPANIQSFPLKEILAAGLASSPEPVRVYVTDGGFETFLIKLQAEMGLHADIAELVGRELLLTLLGFSEPNALAFTLTSRAKVPNGQVSSILEAANKEIFLPLSKKVREAPTITQLPPPVSTTVSGTEWINVSAPSASSLQKSAPVGGAPAPLPQTPASYQPQYQPVPPPPRAPMYETQAPPAPPPRPAPRGYESVAGAPQSYSYQGAQVPPPSGAPFEVRPPTTFANPPSTPPSYQSAPTPTQEPPSVSPYENFHAQARTMAEDMNAIKEGRSPARSEEVGVPTYVPQPPPPMPPRPQYEPAPLAYQAPPQAISGYPSSPLSNPPRPVPRGYESVLETQHAPYPPSASVPTQQPPAYTPPPRVGGSDPYREPVE